MSCANPWEEAARRALRSAKPHPAADRQRRIARALAACSETVKEPIFEFPETIARSWRPTLALACLAAAMLWFSIPPRRSPPSAVSAVEMPRSAREGMDAGEDLGPCSRAADCGSAI
ncbi:MAG: hypothetical protein KGO96_01175 [Elusimicrobia bacterium]|nr:hypothetical protein [Elusimicrobiota bacterium]MDE2237166.1 hypothetical protein [Elusimicrobiota bacterium]MDE2424506.1 hypothetical protein [Elusimicrobiota bacterium]